MPTKDWTLHYGGHDVRVENYWNLLGYARERLFVDGRLVDENAGFLRMTAKLSALLREPDGQTPLEVKAFLAQGFLGLSITCKVWINGELVLGDADAGFTSPGRGPFG